MLNQIVGRVLQRMGLEVLVVRRSDDVALIDSINYDTTRQVTYGAVRQFEQAGHIVRFFIQDDKDEIQGTQFNGHFYEPEELDIIARHFKGGCFVDVGTNVGNHTVFAAKMLNASKVIAFEPNPDARRILELNIALNDLTQIVDLRPIGLSDREDRTALIAPEQHNLGGARLYATADGQIPVRRGDEVLSGERVDFIKIDVEGLEMNVLKGLERTIALQKPRLFIEVEDRHQAEFLELLSSINYEIAEQFQRYTKLTNYLLTPCSA